MIRFTHPETGVSVIVRVNDRGPWVPGREFDLSLGAAQALNIVERGVVRLQVEILRMRETPHE
jgi:rare lipoprotein A